MDYIDIKKKGESFINKIRKSESTIYTICSLIFIVGLVFLLNSNKILNKDFNNMSTELNKQILLTNVKVELKNREFNPETGLVKFTIEVKPNDVLKDNAVKVELKEKAEPQKILNTNLIKISDDEYVVYANLNKKWTITSLNVIVGNEESSSKNSVKLYSDIDNITKNNKLKQEDKNTLNAELTEDEIKSTRKEISETVNKIEEKNNSLTTIEDKIKSLEENKKYQTDSEKVSTDTTISSLKTSMENIKNEVKEMEKKKKELEKKIKKLEEKKQDLKEK